MLSLILASALVTQQPASCPNVQCYRSGVSVYAPGVSVQVGAAPSPPPVVIYARQPSPYTCITVRRGLFSRVRVFVE